MTRHTGILAALVVTAAIGAAAQIRPSDPALTSDEFRIEYIRILREYTGGDADRAVADLTRLPPSATHSFRERRRDRWGGGGVRPHREFTLTPQATQRVPVDESELQMSFAAVMVETEAAFLAGRGEILTDRLRNAEQWLGETRQLFARTKWSDFHRQWSLAVGRKTLWEAVLGPADEILRVACDLFGDDAALQVAYGLARETTAHVAGSTPPPNRSVARYLRQHALSDARTALERALRLDAKSALSIEARVRLARVHILLGDDRRAAPLLEQALSQSPSPVYAYVAALLSADLEARAGRLDRATARYLEARQQFPGAQNSFIAHAHALRAAGKHAEAEGVLKEMLSRSRRTEDPWMQYPKGFDLLATGLEPLRALVRGMREVK